MVAKHAKNHVIDQQWPTVICLCLCGIFAALVLLLAKRDYDAIRNQAKQNAALEAKLILERLDTSTSIAQASLNAVQQLGVMKAIETAAAAPGIQAIAGFDASGALIAQGTAASGDIGALATVSPLTKQDSWRGALASEASASVNAIAVKTADGGTIAAFVTLPNLEVFGLGSRIGIGNSTGALLRVQPMFKSPQTKLTASAFGIKHLPPKGSSLALFGQDLDGQSIILGIASSQSGMISYVARDRGPMDLAILRSAILFGLLFLGPVIAGAGIWIITQRQALRFATNRSQLREVEQRLRVAIEGARCGVWDWDITHDQVFLSKRLAHIFGLPGAGRFAAQSIFNALDSKDQACLRAALAASAQKGVLDVVLQVKWAKGVKHVQLRGRAVKDRQNPALTRAIGVSIDVSDARRTEERLIQTERRLNDTISSISGPFALWSKERRLVLWNDGFAKTFGLSAAVLQQGASYHQVSAAAAKCVKSQRPDRYDELAQEIELDNGVWIQLVERETFDGGLVSIGIDITPLKEIEENIRRSERQMRSVVVELERSEHKASELAEKYNIERQRAEEASNAKSGFLANMSHELRTPLNAINGFSEIMVQQLYGPLGDRRYLTYATDILNSGKHLLELINDVLDMAKVEAGKFKIYPKPMDLHESIEQAIRLVRGRAEEKRISLVTELNEDGEMIGDARAIKQIMINLLTNAIKFTAPNGKILVQIKNNLDEVIIRVIDNGVGINQEDLPRLTRPFEQVENEHARSNQGSGLGLALSRSFAELHGGSLSIASEVGVGTMVIVSLPRLAVAEQEAA
ncbi:non-motile and phage-resistance protein [Candidatus Phycosocius spiralis]|uniref:histidine kinase n=2 Tax=Candidatus Phycosocius spiralis TaxID=2815099 RepID=A0ABQ4PWF6_9PROT|nr:non-motile and phage-resistance protein [Candidatus Phycosocius spiralis]